MSPSRKKMVVGVAAIACCLTASIAAADDLVVAEAKQRMAEGKDLYASGQYDAAWLKYKQACVVIQSDNCARGLAVTEFKSKRWLDAYQHLRALLLPTPKPSLTAPVVSELTRMMLEAYAKTGHISVRVDAGATLSLDGVALSGPPAETLDVASGAHIIEATYRDKTRRLEVNVPEGTLVNADLTLPVMSVPVATPVLAPPVTRAPEVAPLPGEHVSTGGNIVRWGLTGVAAVSLGLAVGLNAESHSQENSASSYITSHPGACASATSPSCVTASQLVNSENSSAIASDIFLGVGIATAIGATAAWIFWPKQKDQAAQAWVLPALGPSGAGVQAGGLF